MKIEDTTAEPVATHILRNRISFEEKTIYSDGSESPLAAGEFNKIVKRLICEEKKEKCKVQDDEFFLMYKL